MTAVEPIHFQEFYFFTYQQILYNLKISKNFFLTLELLKQGCD